MYNGLLNTYIIIQYTPVLSAVPCTFAGYRQRDAAIALSYGAHLHRSDWTGLE